MSVTYPGVGPSVCDKTFRVTPGVAAGGVVCADASVATKPVTAQSAQDAIPAKSRRVSMTTSLLCPDHQCPDFCDRLYHPVWPRIAHRGGPDKREATQGCAEQLLESSTYATASLPERSLWPPCCFRVALRL